jgi:hypothetical protein
LHAECSASPLFAFTSITPEQTDCCSFPSAISPVVRQNISSRFAHSLPRSIITQVMIPSTDPKPTVAQPTESFGDYNLIKRIKLDFTDVVVSKWKSSVTGLTVIHLDYEGIILLSPPSKFL